MLSRCRRLFGGDLPRRRISRPGSGEPVKGDNSPFSLNRYHHSTINYFAQEPSPARPSAENLLGTDDRGRDLLARLLYGFRLSVVFALIVTVVVSLIGILYGAIQGYFAGWTDIVMERFNEIWSSMPQLYMLIILSSSRPASGCCDPVVAFRMARLASYVRAEFLRNRTLDTARGARLCRATSDHLAHILPNILTPVVTLCRSRWPAIGALTSLDLSALGGRRTPILGELLNQGKNT